MTFIKTRGHVPQSRFADAAKSARAGANAVRYKRPDGVFDRLTLGEKPLWLRLSPDQLYAQLLYNRETKMVIETGKQEPDGSIPFPARQWLEFTTHFVVSRKRSFTCSSAADRSCPCRGCAERARFYDMLKVREEATGIKDEEARKKVPIQASSRFAMAATVLEKIFEMPLMDKHNKPRKAKDGRDLMKNVPAPLSGYSPQQQLAMPGTFGMNFHWGFGPTHLSQLGSIDTDLWNFCGNCSHELIASEFHCPECNNLMYTAPDGLTGADLRAMREQSDRCKKCNYEGFMSPILACTNCSEPSEGSIMVFDLRLRLEKDPTDDKKSTLRLVGHRVPDYSVLYDNDTASRIYELVYHPLDIAGIYAPESLEAQAWALPDDMKDNDPSYHLKKKAAVPYGTSSAPVEDEPDGDADQMDFPD